MSLTPEETVGAAVVFFEEAAHHESEGLLQKALEKVKRGLYALDALKARSENTEDRRALNQKQKEYLQKAQELKERISKGGEVQKASKDQYQNANAAVARMKDDLSINPVRFTDVIGLEQAKLTVNEVFKWPLVYPSAFEHKTSPKWRAVVLYGPPGTGKTQFARACATELKCAFYNADAGDIMSMYLGESEKTVNRLFESARETAPSIIFVDEADAIFGSRERDEGRAVDSVKTAFMKQMDGVTTDATKKVLVIVATNRLWVFDPALLRRLERQVEVPLPTERERVRMFRLFTEDERFRDFNLSEEQLHALARDTHGKSGAAIKLLVGEAASLALREFFDSEWLLPDVEPAWSWIVPSPEQIREHKCERCDTGESAHAVCPGCGWLHRGVSDFQEDGHVRPPIPEFRHFLEAMNR